MISQNMTQKDIMDLHFDIRSRDFLHTSFPAKITRVVNSNVVDVLPLVTTKRPDGSVQPYPELFDVRLHTYACQRGGVYISLPIKIGDLVWVLVSERDTSKLMASDASKAQPSITQQTHDLSDCFAIPAFFPDGNLQNYDPDNLVIGNNDTRVVVKPSEINVETLSTTFNGSISVQEQIVTQTSVEAPSYITEGQSGASGTFISQDGKTITVLNGLVVNIV